MRDFEYEAPNSLTKAVQLLTEHQGRARPLAGGTDLIDYIRTGRLIADVVVDVKHIPELTELAVNDDGVRIGAAVNCRSICAHSGIKEYYSAIHDACSIIGGVQIQNRASIGGNLCTSGAAADSTPALIALGATCEIASSTNPRTVPVEKFCTGPATNQLQPGELLVAINIPALPKQSGSHYRRFIPRNEMDIAVVGVGATVGLNENGAITHSRIGLGAVSEKPFLADEISQFLGGKTPDAAVLKAAGELARTLVSPIEDHRGTVEFRTHVVGVLVERVLASAIERASASNRKS